MNAIELQNVYESLYPYQQEVIQRKMKDYVDLNHSSSDYEIAVCPKCGAAHPKWIRGGRSHSGKQMIRCPACRKRIVVDHGQLTYYSHQDQSKWDELI